RKGKSDTALKTAEAGYLTRRLVDAVQDVIVREEDCGQTHVFTVNAKDTEAIGIPFESRIFGRTLSADVKDSKGKVLLKAQTTLGLEEVKKITDEGIREISVRSLMSCVTESGVCQKCYGLDLGTNKPVELGLAAGIIAAQSIGEPGTQLTMRTFHMGGVAEGSDITQGLTRVEELFEARTPKEPAVLSEIAGTVDIEITGDKKTIHITSSEPVVIDYEIPEDYSPIVKVGDIVKAKKSIAKGTEHKGSIKTIEEGEIKEVTSTKITISTKGNLTKSYKLSKRTKLKVTHGGLVTKGEALTSG